MCYSLRDKMNQGVKKEDYYGHKNPYPDGSSIEVLVINLSRGIPAHISQPLGDP